MWLGTYQPNYTLEELRKDPELYHKGDYPEIPFTPIFCIPCEDPIEMFISGVLCEPRYCDLFYMFETEDYMRLDKQKWHLYQEFKTKERMAGRASMPVDINDLIADVGTPDIDCEFVIDKTVFDNSFRSQTPCVAAYPAALPMFFNKKNRPPITLFKNGQMSSFGMSNAKDCAEHMRMLYDQLIDLNYRLDVCMQWDRSLGYDLDIKKLKFLFDSIFLSVLPYFIKGCYEPGSLVLDYNLVNPCYFHMMRVCVQYHEDRRAGFDLDDYHNAVNVLRSCVSGDLAFMDHLFKHGRPQRNDACPCGSGKKYKKCCGRYAF